MLRYQNSQISGFTATKLNFSLIFTQVDRLCLLHIFTLGTTDEDMAPILDMAVLMEERKENLHTQSSLLSFSLQVARLTIPSFHWGKQVTWGKGIQSPTVEPGREEQQIFSQWCSLPFQFSQSFPLWFVPFRL